MKNLLLYLAWGWLLIVLQISLFAFLPLGEARPDLLFFLIIFLAVEWGTLGGAVLVTLLAYLLDLVSATFFGLNTLLALGTYFTVGWISQRVDPRHLPFQAAALAIFSVVEILVFWFFPWLLNPGTEPPAGLFPALAFRTAGNLLLGLPILKLFYLVETWRGSESALQL